METKLHTDDIKETFGVSRKENLANGFLGIVVMVSNCSAKVQAKEDGKKTHFIAVEIKEIGIKLGRSQPLPTRTSLFDRDRGEIWNRGVCLYETSSN